MVTDCSVVRDAERVVALSGDLAKAIRKLRGSLKRCEACENMEDCRVWREFNAKVDVAIREVNQEWGMT